MQLRCLHADGFSFEVRNHDPDSETRSGASADLGGSVVVFVAVERSDAERPGLVAAAADRISEMADRLDERVVALVPCAQLTDAPAANAVADDAISALADRLEYETHTVPLGESISFELDARGHPFANQRFEVEAGRPTAGEWFRLASDGSLTEIADDADGPVLDDGRVEEVSLAQLLKPSEGGPVLFDAGGTVLPEGVFVRDLLVDLATERLRIHGAVPAERPTRSDPVSELVFGGDGPASVFESTAGADETGRPGPTLTTAVRSLDDGRREAREQIALVAGLLGDLSVPFEPVCRCSDGFVDEHRDWLAGLGDLLDQPLVIDQGSESGRPFAFEFAVLGEHARLATPTVWIEEDPTRTDGDRLVVRSNPLDEPLRFVAALRRTRTGERPTLPVWLAPVQFRLIPIEPDDIDACERVVDDLDAAGVRADIDDRDLPVSERLQAASEQWVPYDAVVSEGDGETLRVTSRVEQTERTVTPAEIADQIREETAGWPTGTRPVERRYSDRVLR
ncbi:hypothetical protein GRX03_00965 [Halovenus sp. WSH3]|uniref:Uncharacterized protein n=1 Tax=Halovenus carboxidivorans TaxID=2692199 RepID=A0A6B0T4M7_9EURY|nr:threonyl-tRNA synthetase editing domain-containing protein [Halovenus carboxidivorans]MXR50181.1 hypothetical protein [Halovenus carboxidivorans]